MKAAVIMGSASDEAKVEKRNCILKEYGVDVEVRALSAHRAHRAFSEFVEECNNNGTDVILTAAGMAAALPGVVASMTVLPVIGIPIKGASSRWNGDASCTNCPDAFWYPSCNSCN